MSNIFQNTQTQRKRYNNFNLGREVLTSGRIGKLIPVQCDEVVPGDHFNQSAAFLCRFSPLSAPAMARFNVHFHSFYVPLRIITPETSRESTYERFIKSIGKHSDEVPTLPYMYGTPDPDDKEVFGVGTLSDYLGLPFDSDQTVDERFQLSALYHLGYQRIYQDFYRRDQIEMEAVYPANLVSVHLDDAYDTGNFLGNDEDYGILEDNQRAATIHDLFTLQTRNYERDYFTSALPEPQFGDEVAVGNGTVEWLGDPDNIYNFTATGGFMSIDDYGAVNSGTNAVWAAGRVVTDNKVLTASGNTEPFPGNLSNYEWEYGNFAQQLSSELRANTFTINEFRLAMQLQGIKETINRVGTRYLEIMQGIYGVRVPDARLQRPIYLGGFKNPVTIGSVMQTSETGETPQGTLTGQMSAAGSNKLCSSGYEFKEHGILYTIISITPRTSYYGGIPKKFLKRYPEEFYLPQFDHLGEQTISTLELYGKDIENADNVRDFGYTPHYAELKSAHSTVHGEFRTTLDNWHVSRDFDSRPALNPDFIKAEPEDFDRIFAFENIPGTSNEHFQMQIYLDVRAKRNMSKYSTPYTLY